jgi:hypothetical protein
MNVSNFLSSSSRIEYSDFGRPLFYAAGKYVRFYLAIESPVVSKVILSSSIILEVGSLIIPMILINMVWAATPTRLNPNLMHPFSTFLLNIVVIKLNTVIKFLMGWHHTTLDLIPLLSTSIIAIALLFLYV